MGKSTHSQQVSDIAQSKFVVLARINGIAQAPSNLWKECLALFGDEHMPLVNIVVILAIVGLLLWLVNRYIPMQSQIKSILNGLVVIVVVLWLLRVFGVLDTLTHYRVGR